jgi:hypothetical protein
VDTPLEITRSSGLVSIGGASGTAGGLSVLRNTGVAMTVTNTATGGTGVSAVMADTTSRATQASVSGDTVPRFAVFADGKTECGTGSAAHDVNLYRSSADVLRTDDSLHVGVNLRINTTSLAARIDSGELPVAGARRFVSGGRLGPCSTPPWRSRESCELCVSGGLMHIRRTNRERSVPEVSETERLVRSKADRMWTQLISGRAR